MKKPPSPFPIGLLIIWLAAVLVSVVIAPRARSAELTTQQVGTIYALAWGQYGGALPEQPPMIELVPQSRLRELAGCERCPVRGMHMHGTIYLDQVLDFAQAYDASILLHEYIHYFQWVAHGDAQSCEEALERERRAYAIQAHVLAKTGNGTMNVLHALRMLTCRDTRK